MCLGACVSRAWDLAERVKSSCTWHYLRYVAGNMRKALAGRGEAQERGYPRHKLLCLIMVCLMTAFLAVVVRLRDEFHCNCVAGLAGL